MSARDDNPQLHRIVVERDADGVLESVRFVCDGDDTAPCHQWPDCGCETWDAEHNTVPGHENVPQAMCWMDPWFNDTTSSNPADFADLFTGDPLGEGMSDPQEQLVSGPVTCEFEGDYMTWEYADTTDGVTT